MGGGFHGCDVLILAFLLTSYVQNLSTANLCVRPIFVVGSMSGFGKGMPKPNQPKKDLRDERRTDGSMALPLTTTNQAKNSVYFVR